MRFRQTFFVPAMIIIAMVFFVAPLPLDTAAGTPGKSAPDRGRDQQATQDTVELFQAMDNGEIEVQLIPKDSTQSTVIIKNKLARPLKIKLPEAFAGVPVLAQVGLGDPGGRGGGGGGGNQGIGGGMMGGMGMGGMGMGMGGMFSVGPAAVRKFKVATVCLEHGKPDPNPRVPYALKSLESFTTNQSVIELCKMLGRGEIDQHAAQAVAWHFTDGLAWDELARKIKIRHLNGLTEPYFQPLDLRRAYTIAQAANQRATQKALSTPKSPGEFEAANTFVPIAGEIR